ncbi:Transcriptional regulatory protein TcrA [Pseudobythopirellula maris]|uniref:Transcriptional regulatory protein TcrA n=1 Tax=Pseudobythopirellula maris TaxID=2527991 RepID=A0A5C5ZQ80_9BACT|nr:response regulator [Pseudobythopirellula maris]TWT89654.1 Transcriptional regulatory protein TcrA [Pseudobythopirellula maris]
MGLTRRTLVVDDEPQVRELTSRALSRCGFVCDQAEDGQQALEMFDARPYDAVVTDLRMPRLHGHALCMELLDRPRRPKILVLTALAEARLVHDMMSRGVDDVFHKPVRYDVLAMKLAAMFDRENAGYRPGADGEDEFLAALRKVELSLLELSDFFQDRLEPAFSNADDLSDPPAAVKSFIDRLREADEESDGKLLVPSDTGHTRHLERVACYTTAVAVPVSRNFVPCDEAFKVAVRDVSEGGVRLLHTRVTNAEFLALSWEATAVLSKQIRVVAKVTRCRPLSPFYDLGGQFVTTE